MLITFILFSLTTVSLFIFIKKPNSGTLPSPNDYAFRKTNSEPLPLVKDYTLVNKYCTKNPSLGYYSCAIDRGEYKFDIIKNLEKNTGFYCYRNRDVDDWSNNVHKVIFTCNKEFTQWSSLDKYCTKLHDKKLGDFYDCKYSLFDEKNEDLPAGKDLNLFCYYDSVGNTTTFTFECYEYSTDNKPCRDASDCNTHICIAKDTNCKKNCRGKCSDSNTLLGSEHYIIKNGKVEKYSNEFILW